MGGSAVMERRSLMLSSPSSAMGSHVSIRRLVIRGSGSWVAGGRVVTLGPWPVLMVIAASRLATDPAR